MTRDCLEAGLAFVLLGATAVCCAGFTSAIGVAGTALVRFFAGFDFAGFDIEILHSAQTASRRHHRSPTSANKPAGQDPEVQPSLGAGHSTALCAQKSQSFLDNLIAG
jgi:hypothetical protein